jgi:hypothetical protein
MAGKKGMRDKLISSPAAMAQIRAQINAGKLIKRLESHVHDGIEMTQTQIKASEILLRKCIPDLANVTVAGDPDNPVNVSITEIVRKIIK